jgi:hypothetical protein
MPPKTRAARVAQDILAELNVAKLDVRIREIARKYAYIVRDPLPDDVSGMLIPSAPGSSKKWIIVVNKNHPQTRQNFSMAHELAHLVLHGYTTPHADGGQPVRFRNETSSLGTDKDEIEANQFAAELLMPEHLLMPRLQALGLTSWDGEPSKDALELLANECKVSPQALMFRIAGLLQAN